MKTFLSGGLLLLACTTAHAEWAFANGAVNLDVTGSTTYDSNIEGSSTGTDDVYFRLAPTARYKTVDSRIASTAELGYTADRYVDNKSFDRDDIRALYNLNLARAEGDTFSLHFSIGYVQNTTQDADLSSANTRVSSDTFSLNLGGDLVVAKKHVLTAALAYEDAKRDVGSDQKTKTANLGYSFIGFTDGTAMGVSAVRTITESAPDGPTATAIDQTSDSVSFNVSRPLYGDVTAAASIGYNWIDRSEDENSVGLEDSDSVIYSLSLNGQFLPKKYFPKTTGTFRIAYEKSAVAGLNEAEPTERLVGALNIAWQARERTSIGLNLNRSQDLTIDDNTAVNNSAGITVSQKIGDFITSNAGFTYTLADYPHTGRQDTRYQFDLGASYAINRKWSTGGNYTYLLSDSDASFSDYDRHTLTLSLTYVF